MNSDQISNLRDRCRQLALERCTKVIEVNQKSVSMPYRVTSNDGTGDSILWSALLNYSGEAWAGTNIVEAKDHQGGMWRSALRQRDRVGPDGLDRFSMDHALGVLLFLVTEWKKGRGDAARAFANHWGSWMVNHLSNTQWSICNWDVSSMDACLIGGALGGRGALIAHVFRRIGADVPSTGVRTLGEGSDVDEYISELNIHCSLTGSFHCHLRAVLSLLFIEMGEDRRGALLPSPSHNHNPFVRWVHNGCRVDQSIAADVEECLNRALQPRTEFNDWSWEWSHWYDSSSRCIGWDMVAMANLCLRSVQGPLPPNRSREFDVSFYLDSYPDLRAAFGFDFDRVKQHWTVNGLPVEGRRGSAEFDVHFYLESYPDLKTAFGTNFSAAMNHWENQGLPVEGRKGSREFDVRFYLDSYPDLKAAFGTNFNAATDHWITQGLPIEGRKGSGAFDVRSYINRYPDIRSAFGMNFRSALMHWTTAGIFEGRQGV